MSGGKCLKLILPDGNIQKIDLPSSRWTLGRSSDNDYCCPEDAGISRHHLILEEEDGWWASDPGSKNGVYLNGERIRRRIRLQPRDTLTLSKLTFIFDPVESPDSTCAVVFDPTHEVAAGQHAEYTTLKRLIASPLGSSAITTAPKERLWASPLDLFRRAGRELTLHQPLCELFQTILDLSIDAVGADRGLLLIQEREELVVRAFKGDNFRISATVRDQVLNEKTSLLLKDVLDYGAYRTQESIVSQHIHSLIAVPLQTDEQVLGMIYVDTLGQGRRFDREDLELLTIMANVAALRIERERLAQLEQARRRLARDLDQAAEIQRQFLPAHPPEVPGIALAGYNHPCQTVGGDYYDYVVCPHGRVAVIIGDVCGKGLAAALLMMNLQSRVQVLAEEVVTPAALLSRLNRVLLSSNLHDRFISLFVTVLESGSDRLFYCNAGHNPPLLLHVDGSLERLDEGGPVLGILPNATYQENNCQFRAGDVLLLYSDGITEACNPEGNEFEESRLREFLQRSRHQPVESICDGLMEELHRWMAGNLRNMTT